jgi:hypothetical protein
MVHVGMALLLEQCTMMQTIFAPKPVALEANDSDPASLTKNKFRLKMNNCQADREKAQKQLTMICLHVFEMVDG